MVLNITVLSLHVPMTDVPVFWDSCLKVFRGHASGLLHHHILFLMKEHMFCLTFLTRNLSFEICLSVSILLISEALKC